MSDPTDYEHYEAQRAERESAEDELDRLHVEDADDSSKSLATDSAELASAVGARRFAVVVGHTRRSPGATGVPPISQSEYIWNLDLSEMIVTECGNRGVACKVFLRDGVGIEGAYAAVNRFDPSACVELHFNAFNRQATGCEVLHGDRVASSARYARVSQAALVGLLGNRDRGLKLRRPDERGGLNVALANCASILIEPFFGDQADDAALGHHHKRNLARRTVDAFIEFDTQT